ncbi:class I SAM-dependent methyltransferase, partial [Tateyamaria sp. syn59]|uniref:class I SAM-dependent methyltransferase n=1 Tax=Tateyamaria sp. syn59 TaxID=2576942 RepID=UPI00167370FE
MRFETEVAGVQSLVPVFSRSLGSWRLSVERRPYSESDLADRYDRKSGAWHKIIERHRFHDAYRDVIDRVMRQPRYRQKAQDLRVLDAGIGTGAMSSAFHQQLGRRFRLNGIDISLAMLGQADARLSGEEIDVALTVADLTSLPYAENLFDVVLAAHVIEHLPVPQAALKEMFRVLKPGGIVICCITRPSATGAYIQLMWRTHRVSRSTALGWFVESGFEMARAFPLQKRTASRRF